MRWGLAISLIILFVWRVIYTQVCVICINLYTKIAFKGFYIVTYALFIYYLNLFLAFLTPKIDPALELDSDGNILKRLAGLRIQILDDEGPVLPRSNNEEFRPFMRRLPEFKFWFVCF